MVETLMRRMPRVNISKGATKAEGPAEDIGALSTH